MRHPVQQLLQHHATSGTIPSDDELKALRLDASTTATVKAAATEARDMRRDSDRVGANAHALDAAASIVGSLDPEQQDPGYLRPDPNEGIENLGPRELAARILGR